VLFRSRFADDEEVETEVRKWLRQQSKDFCAAGFERTGKVMEQIYQCCWMSRNKCFSQVRFSHVLRFYPFVTYLVTLLRMYVCDHHHSLGHAWPLPSSSIVCCSLRVNRERATFRLLFGLHSESVSHLFVARDISIVICIMGFCHLDERCPVLP
jgi:hypothetical protein